MSTPEGEAFIAWGEDLFRAEADRVAGQVIDQLTDQGFIGFSGAGTMAQAVEHVRAVLLVEIYGLGVDESTPHPDPDAVKETAFAKVASAIIARVSPT